MAESRAYAKHPQHRIEIDESPVCVRITRNGEILADTTRGLNLREGKYPAVVYIPREDVVLEKLQRSSHTTHCPFKGDATYFDYQIGSESTPEVAWSYETPFDQMSAIRNHLAFYADRVEIDVT